MGLHSRSRISAAVVATVVLLVPLLAFADAGGEAAEGGRGGEEAIVVGLIAVVGLAYLGARFVVGRLQKRFLVMAGVEYVVLGVLLGEQMPYDIPAFSSLDELLPIVALAVGWVGLLRGMELSIEHLRKDRPTGATQIVVVQSLVAGGLTSGLAYLAFSQPWFGTGVVLPRQAWMAAGVMGCAAAAGSVGPIELLRRRYRLEGELTGQIRRMAAMSDLIAIFVFGLLFCVFHEHDEGVPATLSWFEWAGVSLLLGGVLGVFFRPFLGDDDSENGRFLAMVGVIVLASGAAYFLDLSPLFVNLVLGVVLVNTAKAGPQIRETLESTKAPMAIVLFVFAGALWRPPDLSATEIVLVCLLYVILRIVGKWIGTGLAAWRTSMRKDTYRGLLAHGTVSVAMAVSLRLVYDEPDPAIDLAYTAILSSVVVNDLIAPRVLRGLLVDTGDLRGERKEEPA